MIVKKALLKNEIEEVKTFLKSQNLNWENDIIETYYITDDKDQIIATGSRSKDIIKGLRVLESWQGYNLMTLIVNELIKSFNDDQVHHFFVYTKLDNHKIFESLGFSEITRSEKVVLFEYGLDLINQQLIKLKGQIENYFGILLNNHSVGSLILNCNPVTKGHLELIELASNESDYVIIFLVETDKSFFTFKERMALLYLATNHLRNVIVIPSTKYIISEITFPSYFLKSMNEAEYQQAQLDINIFKQYFIPIFNINKRYIGSESDKHMILYNDLMKKELEDYVVIIERFLQDNEIISASRVRKLVKENKIDEAALLVPQSIQELFKSIVRSKKHE